MTVSFRSKCALACMFLFYSTAHTSAVTKSWIGGSDNWSNNANWNPFGAPANSDTANIVFGDGVSRTIDYDYVESPISLNALNLDLTGSINIQGALALAIVNGGDDFPLPTLGGQFTLLSAPGGVTSSIENAISLRSVARGSRVDESVTSNGNDAVLQAVAITPLMDGDFNGDGSTNAADYIVWWHLAGGINLAADGNRDGMIDNLDYSVWRANFGRTAGGGPGASANAAIP